MYRLRRCNCCCYVSFGFCIKQRYVSIKTIQLKQNLWKYCSALSSDMYRLRQALAFLRTHHSVFCIKQRYVSIKTLGTACRLPLLHGSALSSDMYRLRRTWRGRFWKRGFCIKQRYVSIKTLQHSFYVGSLRSALSSDMYRLRLVPANIAGTAGFSSALSSDMYRLRQCGRGRSYRYSVLH